MAEEAEDRLNKETAESSEAMSDNESEDSEKGGQERVATPAGAAAESQGEERSTRMNAAKAFYRAMYAGEDVAPDDFGMGGGPLRPEGAGARGCSNCQSMQQQMSQIEAKANEVENLYKRMAADFDNFRKRTEREREELLGLGAQRAVETILPAVDDLDRAQGSFTAESEARNILDSLKLIYNRFTKCLEQMGVKAMDVIGQPFDPKFHEPVQQVETHEQPEGAIVHDLRRGYLMRDKVIRPSLVNVATRPASAPDQPEVAQAPPPTEKVESKEVTQAPTVAEAAAKNETKAAPAAEKPEKPPVEAEIKADPDEKKVPSTLDDLASATAELPAIGSATGSEASEVRVRTHQDVEDEKEKYAAAKKTQVEQDLEERAHAEHKRPAGKTADKPHSSDEDKKASENSVELAEMKAYADRQSSDE
jgi:molecular chaperone GrpE